jgi:hypothetical protein
MHTLLLALVLAAMPPVSYAQIHYGGYTNQYGTYVQPHYQRAPDTNRFNNYSSRGNINPYSGQPGAVNPYNQPYSIQSSQNYQNLQSIPRRRW